MVHIWVEMGNRAIASLSLSVCHVALWPSTFITASTPQMCSCVSRRIVLSQEGSMVTKSWPFNQIFLFNSSAGMKLSESIISVIHSTQHCLGGLLWPPGSPPCFPILANDQASPWVLLLSPMGCLIIRSYPFSYAEDISPMYHFYDIYFRNEFILLCFI